jgi:electron transfer flavoprotein alpha subunit
VIPSKITSTGASANLEKFDPNFSSAIGKRKIVEVRKGKSNKPDFTEASNIVFGGRAMANANNFKILQELSDVIGATAGASRAAEESGYANLKSDRGSQHRC